MEVPTYIRNVCIHKAAKYKTVLLLDITIQVSDSLWLVNLNREEDKAQVWAVVSWGGYTVYTVFLTTARGRPL
jgi:hypothetical protein